MFYQDIHSEMWYEAQDIDKKKAVGLSTVNMLGVKIQ